MSQVDREYITRLKGRYTEKYAMQMDDWTAAILHELNEGVTKLRMQNQLSLTSSIGHIDQAAAQIKGQVHPVHFSSSGQAFFYGLGNWLIFGLTFFFAVGFLTWFCMTNTDFNRKWKFVQQYESVEKFERIYQDGVTIEQDGYEFLVVEPVKDDSIQLGRNYLKGNQKGQLLIPIRTK